MYIRKRTKRLIMTQTERKLQLLLLNMVKNKSLPEAITTMWRGGLFNKVALERLYINDEVQRRVRGGETKVRAIEQLSKEMSCSYEKARAAVYKKQV